MLDHKSEWEARAARNTRHINMNTKPTAEETGLTELLIHAAKVPLRKSGNADYVSPPELNAWILGGKEHTP